MWSCQVVELSCCVVMHSKSVCNSVHQFVGDDAGVITVRPEGRPGSVPAFLSQSRSAPQASAGLPVCWGYKQPCAVERKGTSAGIHQLILYVILINVGLLPVCININADKVWFNILLYKSNKPINSDPSPTAGVYVPRGFYCLKTVAKHLDNNSST